MTWAGPGNEASFRGLRDYFVGKTPKCGQFSATKRKAGGGGGGGGGVSKRGSVLQYNVQNITLPDVILILQIQRMQYNTQKCLESY